MDGNGRADVFFFYSKNNKHFAKLLKLILLLKEHQWFPHNNDKEEGDGVDDSVTVQELK